MHNSPAGAAALYDSPLPPLADGHDHPGLDEAAADVTEHVTRLITALAEVPEWKTPVSRAEELDLVPVSRMVNLGLVQNCPDCAFALCGWMSRNADARAVAYLAYNAWDHARQCAERLSGPLRIHVFTRDVLRIAHRPIVGHVLEPIHREPETFTGQPRDHHDLAAVADRYNDLSWTDRAHFLVEMVLALTRPLEPENDVFLLCRMTPSSQGCVCGAHD